MSQEMTANLDARHNKTGPYRLLWVGGVVTLIVACVAFGLAWLHMQRVKQEYLSELSNKMSLRVQTVEANATLWAKSLLENGGRITEGDLFKLFATEVNNLEGNSATVFASPEVYAKDTPMNDEASQLATQLPLMRNLLVDFVTYAGFISGRLVDGKAQTFMSTEGVPQALTQQQTDALKKVLENGKPQFTSARVSPSGILMDEIIPVMPPQFAENSNKPIAALMLSRLISSKINELMLDESKDNKAISVSIVQQSGQNFEVLSSSAIEGFRRVSPLELGEDGRQAFGKRYALAGEVETYSFAVSVPLLNWWVVAEYPVASINSQLNKQAFQSYGTAALATIILTLLLAVLWWMVVGSEQRKIAVNFQHLYTVIEEQKRLLGSINETLEVGITLTDAFGTHKYANRAFAEAVGRSTEEVVGMDTAAIFGFDTAKRLDAYARQVLSSRTTFNTIETLWLQSKRRHFRISKAPFFADDHEAISGVVTVYQDITELVEAQERSRRMVQQTIHALVRAIEAVDPHLSGHSQLMGDLAVLLAKHMHLPESEEHLLKTAASLSQIGKIFIPREILTKPGALTDEEREQMKRHVDYAKEALKNIEFDLPVVETIYQINERPDGKGYPLGLSDEAISLASRILAVTNGFCAMAKPRSYRAAMPREKIITLLQQDGQKGIYDAKVVDALGAVLNTPAGEKLLSESNAERS